MCYPTSAYDLTPSNSLTAVRDVDDASKTFVRGNRIANAIGVVAGRAVVVLQRVFAGISCLLLGTFLIALLGVFLTGY